MNAEGMNAAGLNVARLSQFSKNSSTDLFFWIYRIFSQHSNKNIL